MIGLRIESEVISRCRVRSVAGLRRVGRANELLTDRRASGAVLSRASLARCGPRKTPYGSWADCSSHQGHAESYIFGPPAAGSEVALSI